MSQLAHCARGYEPRRWAYAGRHRPRPRPARSDAARNVRGVLARRRRALSSSLPTRLALNRAKPRRPVFATRQEAFGRNHAVAADLTNKTSAFAQRFNTDFGGSPDAK